MSSYSTHFESPADHDQVPYNASWYATSGLLKSVLFAAGLAGTGTPATASPGPAQGPQEAVILPLLALLPHNTTLTRRSPQSQDLIQYLGPVADPVIATGYDMQAKLQLQALQNAAGPRLELLDSTTGGWATASRRILSRGSVKVRSIAWTLEPL